MKFTRSADSTCVFYLTDWRRNDKNTRIRARYGWNWLLPNARPYFSLVADIQDLHPLNGRWRGAGGGACHTKIVDAFPDLEPLARWHLCGDDGEPMHYVDNSVYWWECWLGKAKYMDERDTPEKCERCFKSNCVWGALESDAQWKIPGVDTPAPQTDEELAAQRHELIAMLNYRRSALHDAMRADMERFGLWDKRIRVQDGQRIRVQDDQ